MNMILSFILLGIFSGLLGGLLGIGGGVITVPSLYYLLSYYNYPHEHLMQVAISTSLASTCFTTLGSTFIHWRKKAIVPSILILLAWGLVFGCALGAFLAYWMPTSVLRMVFGLAAFLLGPYFLFPRLPQLKIASSPNRSLTFIAFTIGTIASLLGIGGGIFTVPILHGYHVPVRNAVGTSSAATLITATLGSLAFIALGWIATPSLSLGFIDIPAWLTVGPTSLCTALIGARLSMIIPTPYIKRIFGIALLATGTCMLFVG